MQAYSFIVVIPVADRPRHLSQCLGSLQTLCNKFEYDGRISVLVADDSKLTANIKKHQEMVSTLDCETFSVTYFGLAEQLNSLNALSAQQRDELSSVLGDWSVTEPLSLLAHKGASRMRNLAYLKLCNMLEDVYAETLIHFIDSDQEFQVCMLEDNERKHVYAIDYYHQFNEIFQDADVSVLTGKVVGDPPVSPAVMAGNFIQDITDFLQHMTGLDADESCRFHQHKKTENTDAAYHDMAQLFGFEKQRGSDSYDCPVSGLHDHVACFKDLCSRMNNFFYGEHPTRPSYFKKQGSLSDTAPARTVYTGNYVLRPEMLRYFNPFAALNLRMIGPALGRIIRSEIGAAFVSANLPMLHKRTVADSGVSEFRPGVEQKHQHVELTGEFERQFYGDILLFSVKALTDEGPLMSDMDTYKVAAVVQNTALQIRDQYRQQHQLIKVALLELDKVFQNQQYWWNQLATMDVCRQHISGFIENIEHNFGDNSSGWKLINDEPGQRSKLEEIVQTIIEYPSDRQSWEALLAS